MSVALKYSANEALATFILASDSERVMIRLVMHQA